MAESPRSKPVHRLSADAADYDLSLTPRKSELEIQAEIERVRTGACSQA